MSELPDAEWVVDEILAAGFDAVMTEPRLAAIRAKLSEKELKMLITVIANATALIASRQLLRSLEA